VLGRDPEERVLAAQTCRPIPTELEADIQHLIQSALASEEYSVITRRVSKDEFPLDSWVLAELNDDLKLWIDLGDQGVSRTCFAGNYEVAETAFLDHVVKDGMTFVDIGANIGWFTMRAAKRVGPAGRVIAFEPRANTSRHLIRSVFANGFTNRTEIHRAALGASEGPGDIGWHAEGRNPGGTWSLPTDALKADVAASGGIVEPISIVTLDSVIGDRKVDVIKIDIEGAEPLAFAGGARVLSTSRPVILSIVNYHNLPIVSNMTGADYFIRMRSLGFVGRMLDEKGMGGIADENTPVPDARVMNVVFVPTERLNDFNIRW